MRTNPSPVVAKTTTNRYNITHASQTTPQEKPKRIHRISGIHHHCAFCDKCVSTQHWIVKESRIQNGTFWRYCNSDHAELHQDKRDQHVKIALERGRRCTRKWLAHTPMEFDFDLDE